MKYKSPIFDWIGPEDLKKDFAKDMSIIELMDLTGLNVQKTAEAAGPSRRKVLSAVRGKAGADVERGVRRRLLGTVDSAAEATIGIADEIAYGRFARVRDHGAGDVRIEVDYPLFDEPIRSSKGSPIPACVLNFAAYQMAFTAVAMGSLAFVDDVDLILDFLKTSEQPPFQFRQFDFDELHGDQRRIWIDGLL